MSVAALRRVPDEKIQLKVGAFIQNVREVDREWKQSN